MSTNGWLRYRPVWTECVADGDECPNCGESRVDYLIWDNDCETVTCMFCGETYRPSLRLVDADLAQEA